MSKFFDGKLSALEPYTPGEQPKNVSELIKLNTNESPFPPSPRVFEALNRESIENLRLYPAIGVTALHQATADFYGIDPEQVFTANGSDEALAFCFRSDLWLLSRIFRYVRHSVPRGAAARGFHAGCGGLRGSA